jgi:hypothetical protein
LCRAAREEAGLLPAARAGAMASAQAVQAAVAHVASTRRRSQADQQREA